ncbi:hypothetical protein [Actinophytocola sp. NPDC049390]|uniref:LppU/SCO3897 family protein n=1 Tax=Actinophytocola sp. NPDC049390 TaxID=3363894 RepID=UPI0037A2B572
MTTPPYQPGPYGQPSQNPYGQGGYGQQRPPQQPPYGQPQYGAPYGGANDQTQQFGGGPQNPYGGQYGATQQWPGAGGFGGPTPPQPPKKNTGMVVAIVVIALLVLGGSGVGLYLATKDDSGNNSAGGGTSTSATDKTDASEGGATEETATEETVEPGEAIDAQPGDCIKVNVASATNADVETVDCSLPEAMYRVATREETDTETCPNDQYVSYTEEGQLLLCLQLNVAKGDCLAVTDAEDTRVECTSPDATYEVIDVLDGVDDETRCADTATDVFTYPKPPLTICLGTPRG